jgi:peptidoglycan/xylan/chitin deacetylase (PgdA/CDA1 family)
VSVASLRSRVKGLIPASLVLRDLGPRSEPLLLLTFDDGPDPDVTPGVLDRLDAHDARAVFFVVGRRAAAHPALVREIHRRGHCIGNHTFEHRNDADPWFPGYLRELRRCQAVVRECADVTPRLFRPPKGHLSLTSLTVPKLLGLRTVNWSLNVRDWACKTPEAARQAAEELDRQVQGGQIVLLHDDNPHVLELLDIVLPRLRGRGFDLRSAAGRL